MTQGEDIDYDIILDELIKRKTEEQNVEIREKIDEHSEEISQLQEQVEEDDTDENVIDEGKLSPILTSSERKRYQNIGKEFIDGAGKEFQSIIKASKFKSMMSTMKEKFSGKINLIKNTIKKVKRKSGFIEKLLKIIAILGTIAYLFKDKIIAALPEIKQFVTELYEKSKNFVVDLAEKFWNFITTGAKKIISETINKMYDSVTDGIGIFFNETLPNGIFQMYLNILSMFSDDASELVEERESYNQAEEFAKQIAEEGDKKVKEDSSSLDEIKRAQENLEKYKKESGDNNAFNEIQTSLLKRDKAIIDFVSEDKKELIDALNELSKNNINVIDMVKQGQLNVTALMEGIKEANEKDGVTRQEMFEALKSSITDAKLRETLIIKEPSKTLSASLNVNVNEHVKNDESQNVINSNEQLFLESNKMQGFIDSYNKAINDTIVVQDNQQFEQQTETKKEVDNTKESNEPIITHVNATQVITDSLKEAFVNLSKTMSDFLNGNTIVDDIKNVLESTNAKFQNFFNDVLNFAKESIQKMKDFFIDANSFIDKKYSSVQSIISNLSKENKTKEENNKIDNEKDTVNDFKINVHVSIPNNDDNGVYDFVKDVVSIDLTINELVSSSNKLLEDMCKKLDNFDGGHDVKNDSSSNNKSIRQVTSNTIDMNEWNSLKEDVQKLKESSNGSSNVNNVSIAVNQTNNSGINDIRNLLFGNKNVFYGTMI